MRSVTVAFDTPVSASQATADVWRLDGEGMQLSLAVPQTGELRVIRGPSFKRQQLAGQADRASGGEMGVR